MSLAQHIVHWDSANTILILVFISSYSILQLELNIRTNNHSSTLIFLLQNVYFVFYISFYYKQGCGVGVWSRSRWSRMFSAGVGVGSRSRFSKLLESESGVGVGFSELLESELGVGVGFSKLLESESGVGTFVAITDSNVY